MELASVAESCLPRCLSVFTSCPTHLHHLHHSCTTTNNAMQQVEWSTESPARKVTLPGRKAFSASRCSSSLGQVGASAKEVRHKAEATIPGNAASIHAEGKNASI